MLGDRFPGQARFPGQEFAKQSRQPIQSDAMSSADS